MTISKEETKNKTKDLLNEAKSDFIKLGKMGFREKIIFVAANEKLWFGGSAGVVKDNYNQLRKHSKNLFKINYKKNENIPKYKPSLHEALRLFSFGIVGFSISLILGFLISWEWLFLCLPFLFLLIVGYFGVSPQENSITINEKNSN